jgi:hypothetical protein
LLRATCIVASLDESLGESSSRRPGLHRADYTIATVARARDILRSPFSFLFARSQKEELIAEYVIREHHRGRSLAEILDDAHVRNNLNDDQMRRLLERPEVVHAIGEDVIASLRLQR